MSKWNSYLVDSYEPFKGFQYYPYGYEFNRKLPNHLMAIVVTNGKQISVWTTAPKEDVLIDIQKGFNVETGYNLKYDYIHKFTTRNFEHIQEVYAKDHGIQISELKNFKQRKITI